MTRSAPSRKWADAVERGRQITRAGLVRRNLPGLSVAVGVDGDIVWAEGFGWAHSEPGAGRTRYPVQGRRRIQSAHLGCGRAAAGEKRAASRRRDSGARARVPEKALARDTASADGADRGVTTDHGGEAPLSNARSDDGNRRRRCERTVDGLHLDDFAERELLFEPEPGTALRATADPGECGGRSRCEQPFFAFMRTQVFQPLDMRDTTIDVATEAIPARAAFYFPRFGLAGDTRYGPKPARVGDHSCYAGAAAFLSTPSDLVRFGMTSTAVLGERFAAKRKLLKPGTVQLLQTPQRLASGEETGYGLGWESRRFPSRASPRGWRAMAATRNSSAARRPS